MRKFSSKFRVYTVAALFALALTTSPTVAVASKPSVQRSTEVKSFFEQKNFSADRKFSENITKAKDYSKPKSPSELREDAEFKGSKDSDENRDNHDEECGDDRSEHSSSSRSNDKSNKSKKFTEPNRSSEDGDDGDDEGCNSGIETGDLVPQTLLAPTVTACAANASISWSAINAPGYAVIDNYEIRYSSNAGVSWTSAGFTNQTSLVITGLTSGQSYIFQVAAHNANGWGAWSTASSTCTTTPNPVGSLSYSLNGLGNIPTTFAVPTVTLDYADGAGRESLTAISLDPASGPLVQGVYTYDLYIGIPAANTFSFTVVGGSLANTWLDPTLVPALGHPIVGSTNSFLIFGEPLAIYAFSLSAGSSLLSITVNPLV
jgi:hypothetical protein